MCSANETEEEHPRWKKRRSPSLGLEGVPADLLRGLALIHTVHDRPITFAGAVLQRPNLVPGRDLADLFGGNIAKHSIFENDSLVWWAQIEIGIKS